MKKIIKTFSVISIMSLAIPAFAEVTTFKDLVDKILVNGILRPLVPLLVTLAIVVFIYGVLTTVLADGEKREDGKKYMMWGIVGIFVMVSLWGLVAILTNTFGLDNRVQTIQMTVPGASAPVSAPAPTQPSNIGGPGSSFLFR